ncbi:aminopeptidase N [Ooceraea biroi]|uniref:aminopeptidase N n=1 Tax=Ooceraea biroi TaxID=2015173 RepID=UPI000F091C98|nr:aminopeptidase N [Ooceraea biroi]
MFSKNKLVFQIFQTKISILFLQLSLSSTIFTIVGAQIFNDKLNVDAASYRLPENIIPRHYNISMSLPAHLEQLDIGECAIDIEISNATYHIRLHSLDLHIYKEQTRLVRKDGREFKPIGHIYNSSMHILKLQFYNKIRPGFYTLDIKYTVKQSLGKKPGFIFKEFLVKEMNKTKPETRRKLLATAFQSIEARRVFPCWDEPALKATFEININHHKTYKVLSNVPTTNVITDAIKENYLWTSFNITSMISTRDVAIAITDAMGNSNKCDIVNQWSRFHSQYILIQFATDIMDYIFNEQCDFFDWKVDVNIFQLKEIVIPGIEHDVIGKPGLIIYNCREELFIYDAEIDNVAHKMEIARAIAHGITHHWLDPVIPSFWWSHQWLNEAFIILSRTEILNQVITAFPEWRLLDLFVVQIQHEALHLDIDFCIEPLTSAITPAMLRMLQHVISSGGFKQLSKMYLNMSPFSPGNLLFAMHVYLNISEKYYIYSIKDMDEWITQSSYPIVEVIRTNSSTVLIRQYPYYLNRDSILDNKVSDKRRIPITVTTKSTLNCFNTKPHYWLIPRFQENITVHINESDWIIVNLQQIGYYRVIYDHINWKLITNYLNSEEYKNIHILNRAQLIDDAYHFWVANRLKYEMFKEITQYLHQETDYVAWYPMFQALRYISQFLPFQEIEPLKSHVQYILGGLLSQTGYVEESNEADLNKCLRQEAARWGCTFDVLECQRNATDKLLEHLKNPNSSRVSPDWKDWVYCKGSMGAKVETLNAMVKYLSSMNISFNRSFEYLSCSERYCDEVVHYLYNGSVQNIINDIPNSTYILYQCVASHAKRYIDKLPTHFDIYNYIIPEKLKLFSIIINHLQSDYEMYKLKIFVEGISWRMKAEDVSKIGFAEKTRLYNINNGKNKLVELMEK